MEEDTVNTKPQSIDVFCDWQKEKDGDISLLEVALY